MANLITGNDGSNTLQGTAEVDVIYGYNPDGPQSDASTIAATRVAATTPTRSPATSTATACPTSCGKAATARPRSG